MSVAVTFYLENESLGHLAHAQLLSGKSQGGDTKVFPSTGGITATEHLVVRFSATVLVNPMGGKPIPGDPGSRFVGAATHIRDGLRSLATQTLLRGIWRVKVVR